MLYGPPTSLGYFTVEPPGFGPGNIVVPTDGGGPIPLGPTPAPAANLTPAQQAAADAGYVEQYRRSLFLISQNPGYDYGRGSRNRNEFYGLNGLGGGMNTAAQNAGGLFRLQERSKLGAFNWGVLTSGAEAGLEKYSKSSQAKDLIAEVRSNIGLDSAPNVRLPHIDVPESIKDVAQGVFSAARQELTRTPGATAAPRTNYGAPLSQPSTNLTPWLLGGAALLAVILA